MVVCCWSRWCPLTTALPAPPRPTCFAAAAAQALKSDKQSLLDMCNELMSRLERAGL